MQVDQSPSCAHPPCKCLAAEGSKYCGVHCETVVTGGHHEAGDGCGCGHVGCGDAKDVPESAVGGG
jgi:hypothetical protein